MSNLTTHLVVLNLALLQDLARSGRVAHGVGELEFVEQRSHVGTFENLEVGVAQLQFGEVGDVVGAELLRVKLALLLFT
jgi:hypothetical protein